MTKTFEVTLSIKPRVKIHNPEKLVSFVCDRSSPFCQSFYTYSDINDFADSFLLQFHYEQKEFRKIGDDENYAYYKFVEGYGRFKEVSYGKWVLANEDTINDMGLIEVFIDNDGDLEVEWTSTEVD
tara:strand:- start:49 stop:426 length:378 start_codon:yes stop_codon:yes gene_type:complete